MTFRECRHPKVLAGLIASEIRNQRRGIVKPVQSLKYQRFKKQYWGDPVAFIHDCIVWKSGEAPTFYQDEISAELYEKKRECVRGPHGLGKTAIASLLIHWFALTRDGSDWKIPTTASVWRQLTKYLWPEIHKWARKIRWDLIGRPPYDSRTELQTQNLKLSTGEAFAVASDDHNTIEGAHADYLFYVFDEAKTIKDATWDAAEGALSGASKDNFREALALAISTPGEPVGRFYEIHQCKSGYEDWHRRHVTLEDAIKAGRVTREWAEQRKKQWRLHPALYQNRVEGEFAVSDITGIVPLAWLEAAYDRYDDWAEAGKPGKGKLLVVGADVAEGGGNKTVLAPLHEVESEICDLAFEPFREYDHVGEERTATMATCGRIVGIIGKSKAKAAVDAVGVGAGVVHRLAEQGIEVIAFKGGESTDRRDFTDEHTFKDKNAGAWYGVRDLLNPENGRKPAIPRNDKLTGDLTTRRYTIRSDGVIFVESKKDLKKRLKQEQGTHFAEAESDSPDHGDACAMALFEAYTPSITGATTQPENNTYIRRSMFGDRPNFGRKN